MFIFFVNKPKALIPYFLGLALLIYVVLFDEQLPVSVILNAVSFSLWYFMLMVRYYVLSGDEKIRIWEVEINQFKHLFDFFLVLDAIAILSILIFTLKKNNGSLSVPLLFFMVISFIVLHKIVFAKFISQGLKHNSSLKNMSVDEVYKEVREIAIKKLIND